MFDDFSALGAKGKKKAVWKTNLTEGGRISLAGSSLHSPLPSQPQALEVAACGHKNDDGIVALSSCLLGGKSWLVCFGLVCLP